MTLTVLSTKFKSLYVCRFLLEMIGILLVLYAIFGFALAYGLPKAWHDKFIQMTTSGIVMLVAGIGLLLPQIWAKLSSALLIIEEGIRLFYNDAYRWSNLRIYCLFLVPLVLTLWLRAGYSELKIQRLPNAN